jgi:hypothetical protein
MNAFLVVLEHDPEKAPYDDAYDHLYKAISSFKNIHLSKSGYTFLIVTSDSMDEVWRKLYREHASSFTKMDRLYLLPVCKPFRAYGHPSLSARLQEILPDENIEDDLWEA